MLFVLIGDHLQNGWKKNVFCQEQSHKPPAGVVRGRLVGIVAAYVWCQEHHWFAFLLYEFYKAEMLFCVEVIAKVSVAINHKWKFIGWWKAIILLAVFFLKKKVAASAVHSHSLFDECALKAVQFGSI